MTVRSRPHGFPSARRVTTRAGCARTRPGRQRARLAAGGGLRSRDGPHVRAAPGSARRSAPRKNARTCWSASACAAISSAVEANSSAAGALRCVTWSTCVIARLICVDAGRLLADAAATSCTSSAVLRIAGTSSPSDWPARSATFTLDAGQAR